MSSVSFFPNFQEICLLYINVFQVQIYDSFVLSPLLYLPFISLTSTFTFIDSFLLFFLHPAAGQAWGLITRFLWNSSWWLDKAGTQPRGLGCERQPLHQVGVLSRCPRGRESTSRSLACSTWVKCLHS